MRSYAWLLAVLLAGCARSRSAPAIAPYEAPASPIALTPVTGPSEWRGDGLVVPVPEGWAGHAWPAGTPLRLGIAHAETGITLEVWSFSAASAVPGPRPREGCVHLFEDRGAYRSGPSLGEATVASCVYDEPTGRFVEGWYTRLGEREVHVELILPANAVFTGRQRVAPLVSGITATGG